MAADFEISHSSFVSSGLLLPSSFHRHCIPYVLFLLQSLWADDSQNLSGSKRLCPPNAASVSRMAGVMLSISWDLGGWGSHHLDCGVSLWGARVWGLNASTQSLVLPFH